MKTKPNVFEYIDFRKYLTAWREAEKENNHGLTHDYISMKLGMKNRAYFSDLEKGRRTVGPGVLERLIKLFGFNGDEAKYFRAIVGYGQPATVEEREFWFEQAIQLNNTPHKIVDRKTYAYYRKWYHTTIRAYLETCNFRNEYAEASRKLYGRVSPKEVKEAIGNLVALGLVAPDKGGYLKPVDKVLTTGEAVRDELLRCYQLSNIDMLRTVVAHNKPDSCEGRLLTISVSSRGMERIKKRIDQLRSEIISIVHKDEKKADRVYKIAIHTYPESIKD